MLVRFVHSIVRVTTLSTRSRVWFHDLLFQSNVRPKKQPALQKKKEDLLKNDEIEKNSLLLTIESLQSQV